MSVFLLLSTILILCFPKYSLHYASLGLHLWFECMVPVLFPFMILTGIMIRQNMTEGFSRFLYPVFGPLFHLSKNGIYCLFVGFLCGFPMGARVIAQLYERKDLTREEANRLLSFCNNIGPVYFTGFLLPTIGASLAQYPFYLFGMYGIPLLYGIGLGFFPKQGLDKSVELSAPIQKESIFVSLDQALSSALFGITTLGGYMILFNLLNLFPHVLYACTPLPLSRTVVQCLNCVFEITGGVQRVGADCPVFVLLMLPMGGLSCILQTKSMVKNTNLSLSGYLLHKTIQTLLTAVYYFFLLRLR